MLAFAITLALLVRCVESSVWARGNYTTISVADNLTSLTMTAGNLTFVSSIGRVPTTYVATSGMGLWGEFDELALNDRSRQHDVRTEILCRG